MTPENLKNDAIFRRAARAEPQNGPRYRFTLTNRHFLTEEVISGRAARADTQTNTKFQTPFSIGRILDRNVIGSAREARRFFLGFQYDFTYRNPVFL